MMQTTGLNALETTAKQADRNGSARVWGSLPKPAVDDQYLREEILAVASRHVSLDPDKVIVKMERGKHVSTLQIDIELPSGIENKFAATG